MLAPGYKDRCACRTSLHAAALQQPMYGCHTQPTQPTSEHAPILQESITSKLQTKVVMARPWPYQCRKHLCYCQHTPCMHPRTHSHSSHSQKLTHFLSCPSHTQALMHTPISHTPERCLLPTITADATQQQVPVTRACMQTEMAPSRKQRLAQPKGTVHRVTPHSIRAVLTTI